MSPVDFVVCGVQKAGTTTFHAYLDEHPGLQLASRKEVHFFDNEEVFAGSNPDYDIYHRFFDLADVSVLRGEVTPIYLYWRPCAQRMWAYNPNLKLIVLLRNPVDRAHSHWSMESRRDKEHLPFDDALRAEADRRDKASPLQDRVHGYVDRGFYAAQLRRLYQYFSPEQVLVLDSELLATDPAAVLDRTAQFLDVDPFPIVESRRAHVDPGREPMSTWARDFLTEAFRVDVEDLAAMIDWDCRHWLEPIGRQETPLLHVAKG